jgi:hypothetical protein
MSTIKTTNIGHPSAGSDAITLASDGGIQFNNSVSGTGLDHIVTQSFSAVSSVSINNVFSSEYKNYKIISATTPIRIKFRQSESDSSSSLYYSNVFYASNTTPSPTGAYQPSLTLWDIGNVGENAGYLSMDIINPYASKNKTFSCIGTGSGATMEYISIRTGFFINTTQYDGATFSVASGTFSGSISIYGYKS